MRLFLTLLLALLLPAPASAQMISGGIPAAAPTGAPTSLPLTTIASQQGVILDAFRVAGDADDTASMTRAVAAGVPILCGPKTYTVNNFSTGAVASFALHGAPGCVIQRTSASGSQFFRIQAASVVIDGVTFDMNKASVTADQWGVYLDAGGQTVSIQNSVFKNNSGTLGTCLAILSTGPAAGGSFSVTDSEITGCTFNALYLGSVSNGSVSRNYIHDNTSYGIWAGSNGAVSGSNYLTGVVIEANRIARNTTGIEAGAYTAPYSFALPSATHVQIKNNDFLDNSVYAINMEGDYLAATGNHVRKSDPAVVVFGGIDCFSRYQLVANNVVNLPGTDWGIDCGGSVEATVRDNVITANQGTALNTGGNQNSIYAANHLILSGTAAGIVNYAVEAGGGAVFPTLSSGTVIENNTIDMSASTASGVKVLDNAGGYTGTTPTIVRRNMFNTSGGGSGPAQAITWYGAAASILIDGNIHNGITKSFIDALGNGDVQFDWVYLGGSVSSISQTANTRSILPVAIETYGAGGSILYVTPSAGGSGYTAATTLAAAGTTGSGWTGTAQIIGGVIVGVKTTAFGSSYTGTLTVTATDAGGGTGATFTVGSVPRLPTNSTLSYVGNSNFMFQRSGGTTTLSSLYPIAMQPGSVVNLQALGSNNWNVVSATLPQFAIGSMPTCNAAASGAQIAVSGSVSGKWTARCNATNWIAPDGTTIN